MNKIRLTTDESWSRVGGSLSKFVERVIEDTGYKCDITKRGDRFSFKFTDLDFEIEYFLLNDKTIFDLQQKRIDDLVKELIKTEQENRELKNKI